VSITNYPAIIELRKMPIAKKLFTRLAIASSGVIRYLGFCVGPSEVTG